MVVSVEFISGFVIGFEVFWGSDAAVLELGIARIVFDWRKDE